MWKESPAQFIGVKIALLVNHRILTYLRDDKPNILHPGEWDVAGGGREGNETAFECAAREVYEEFGIVLSHESIRWNKTCPSAHIEGAQAVFMVAEISEDDIVAIQFGDEGQEWRLMTVVEFLAHNGVRETLKSRLRDYLGLSQVVSQNEGGP